MKQVAPLLLILLLPSCFALAAKQPRASGHHAAPSASAETSPSTSPEAIYDEPAADDIAEQDPIAIEQAAVQEQAADAETEPIEDEVEPSPPSPPARVVAQHPLTGVSDKELEARYLRDPASLGPMSVGRPNAGALVNGVRLPEGERWHRVDPGHAWGTQETVDYLIAAIDKVHERHPATSKMFIGHISGRNGGHLSPHLSHQSGRDVDTSYYLKDDAPWYSRATGRNLDLERTWTFVRALITETDVEMILIDTSIQKLLKEYAAEIGESPEWLNDVFQYGSRGSRPLIRHARGHATHIHVRFFNPVAQETGRRTHRVLIAHDKVKAPVTYVQHRCKAGETLGSIANRYATTVAEIQRLNGLRNTQIFAKRVYKIPRRGAVQVSVEPRVVVPARRLPPFDPPVKVPTV